MSENYLEVRGTNSDEGWEYNLFIPNGSIYGKNVGNGTEIPIGFLTAFSSKIEKIVENIESDELKSFNLKLVPEPQVTSTISDESMN